MSWCLPKQEVSLDTIWEFCKPQANEVTAHFDLLTSFRQGNKSIDEWYNVVQTQINLARYPPENAKILHRDIFWFFMKDEEFVSKTINEGSVNLYKFPASKLHQLAKKMESSKATARHIRQVAGDPRAAQTNLMCHQCTELPNGNIRRGNPQPSRSKSITRMWNRLNPVITRRVLTLNLLTRTKTDVTNVVIPPILRGSSAQ